MDIGDNKLSLVSFERQFMYGRPGSLLERPNTSLYFRDMLDFFSLSETLKACSNIPRRLPFIPTSSPRHTLLTALTGTQAHSSKGVVIVHLFSSLRLFLVCGISIGSFSSLALSLVNTIFIFFIPTFTYTLLPNVWNVNGWKRFWCC